MRRHEDAGEGGEVVELAALADGSLSPERRAAFEAQVADSTSSRIASTSSGARWR